MKVLVSVDIEGIVGVASRADIWNEDQPGYQRACELMTKETNAVVNACAGCEVFVVDAHGSGKNILRDKLNPNCTLLERSPKLTMMTGIEKVDAVLFIGYHAMAGKKSFCAHTNSSVFIKSLHINGVEVSEGVTNAMIGKHFNVKTLFIAGTDEGVAEVKKAIPSIYSVVSLESINIDEAKPLPIEQNLEKIKEQIKKAMDNKDEIEMIDRSVENLTFEVELKQEFPGNIEGLSTDKRKITFKANNIVEGYEKYREIIQLMKPS